MSSHKAGGLMRFLAWGGVAGAVLACGESVRGQCVPGFVEGEPGASGISDNFSAYVQPMVVYNSQLVLGGTFGIAGPFATRNVVLYDPATEIWSRVGGGLSNGNTNGYVAALAVYPINGVQGLFVGGQFANAIASNGANVPATRGMAAWDGQQWNSLGTGWTATVGGSAWTMLAWPQPGGSTRLVVGGGWDTIGTATANGIAFWDGEAWNNIGGSAATGIDGTFSPVVFCSAIYNNQLFIGGRFASVGGIAAPNIARWSGTAWQRPGSNFTPNSVVADVSSLHVWNDGTGAKLYAGGSDMRVGTSNTSSAAWNGTTWTRVGQNLGGRTTSLANFNDGTGDRLYCGLTADAQQKYLYRLENNVWTPVANGVSSPITGNFPSIFGLFALGDSLWIGGDFSVAGAGGGQTGITASGIARYAPCDVPACDSIDFNNDSSTFDPQDINAFISVYSEGLCVPVTAQCNDIDFNNDASIFDPCDISSFLRAYSEGGCTPCGV